MLTLLFLICMVGIFGKLLFWGIRASWSIVSFLLTVVFLPVILVVMVIGGLLHIAFPILLVVGVVVLIAKKA